MWFADQVSKCAIVVRRAVPAFVVFCVVGVFLCASLVRADISGRRSTLALPSMRPLTTGTAKPGRRLKPMGANAGCLGSFFPCDLSPGQDLTTPFQASGTCEMQEISEGGSDTSPWIHLSFNPVIVQGGQISTVTIASGLPNVVSGEAEDGVATYACGGLALLGIPTVISGEPMPEEPGPAPPLCPCSDTGKPVDVTTGEEKYSDTDVSFSGPFGISFTRTYGSMSIGSQVINGVTYGPTDLGSAGWQSNYDAYVYYDPQAGWYVFHDEHGGFHYLRGPSANGGSYYNSVSAMTFSINAAGTQWTVSSWDGRQWFFNTSGLLIGLADRHGNTQTVTRNANGGIVSVTDPLGRALCFYDDANGRITTLAWESSGSCPGSAPVQSTSTTVVTMAYDSGVNCTTGQLCSVTEPDGQTWSYQYASGDPYFPNGLTEVVDPLGDIEEQNTYAAGQVVQQSTGNCTSFPCADTGGFLTFAYPSNGSSYTTTVTDGEGRQTNYSYDGNSYEILGISGPLCQCGGDQTRTYTYDGDERLLTVTDDGNGSGPHTITYTYGEDAYGENYPNPTQVTENLDNNSPPTTRSTEYTYYPVGDPRQDLPQTITLPSVDTSAGSAALARALQQRRSLR